MKFKPLTKESRIEFVMNECDKRGLNVYQCNGCHVLISNNRKPQVCALCLSVDIVVVKESIK